jgi:hypothetical protein
MRLGYAYQSQNEESEDGTMVTISKIPLLNLFVALS